MAVRPLARSEALVTEQVGDEVVVLDTQTQTAHCLSPVAAAVWRACDGRREVAAIADHAGLEPAIVEQALEQLDALELLHPAPRPGVSRRDALRRLAGTGVAAVAAPLIYSAALSPAMAAASTALCSSCTNSTCATGYTCTSSKICVPNGSRAKTCTVGAVCSLGIYHGTCVSCAGTTYCTP